MILFEILVGAALLLCGRRLFWLFVGGVGFIVGAMLATTALGNESPLLVLLIAVGLIGALVALVLQHVVIAIAGFLAGGYLLYVLAIALGGGSLAWIAFLFGGVIGAILVVAVFHWALILLSSLVGAAVISQHLPLDRAMSALAFLALCVVGIVVQGRQMVGPPPVRERPQP